ncbi:hypothetical protein [Lysobacter sp. CFH 32150]|uniref:hypothetical protein n=1 Tax=Lysobacter sp. CFH 32150 TaxID=2927128 RepID=UPI001FA7F8DF|nr:hypothetical protein [Lysobacter sp. CFH 32150]MCI4568457.1 hypothetical protein [Lysobacter sp. CFH 32150]
MRKAFLMLAIATCAASPLALAQSRDISTDSPSTAVATPVQTQAAEATSERAITPKKPKSAFGQVMAVLTHLLQEAATKQATGAQPDTSLPGTPSDHSALTITVTPIAGQTTFTPVENTADNEAIPASVDADAAVGVPAGKNAQLAVQAEEDGAG